MSLTDQFPSVFEHHPFRSVFLNTGCCPRSTASPVTGIRREKSVRRLSHNGEILLRNPKNVSLNPNHQWHYETPEPGDTHRWMSQKQNTSLGRVVALCECGPPITLCGEWRMVMKRNNSQRLLAPSPIGAALGENKCSAHRSRPVASNETEAVPVCQQQGTRGPSWSGDNSKSVVSLI